MASRSCGGRSSPDRPARPGRGSPAGSPGERPDLFGQRPEHEAEALDGGHGGDDIDGEDREPPRQSEARQALDRWIEQIDEDQSDHEGAERLPPEIQKEADDDRGDDQQPDSRRRPTGGGRRRHCREARRTAPRHRRRALSRRQANGGSWGDLRAPVPSRHAPPRSGDRPRRRPQDSGPDLAGRARPSCRRLPDVDRHSGLSAVSDPARDAPGPAAGAAPRELRQRWRVTHSRASGAPAIPHREIADQWLAALLAGDLPMVRPEGTRAPAADVRGTVADRHAGRTRARRPVPRRAAAGVGRPAGGRGGGPERGRRRGAVRRLARRTSASRQPRGRRLPRLHRAGLRSRSRRARRRCRPRLLAAPTIPRQREKGRGLVAYDLRPLLADIHVLAAGPARLRIRTLFHPERGAGRPEEAIAALGDVLGKPLETSATVRERVILADELDEAR